MTQTRTTHVSRLADVLLGSIVVGLTGGTGVGAVAGGWLAGRRSTTPRLGALTGAVAGLAGALPWATLVYLASAGAIDPVGYHENGIHIGINTAAPGLLVPWQEVALAALIGWTLVVAAVCGGIVAGLETDVLADLQRELPAN